MQIMHWMFGQSSMQFKPESAKELTFYLCDRLIAVWVP